MCTFTPTASLQVLIKVPIPKIDDFYEYVLKQVNKRLVAFLTVDKVTGMHYPTFTRINHSHSGFTFDLPFLFSHFSFLLLWEEFLLRWRLDNKK